MILEHYSRLEDNKLLGYTTRWSIQLEDRKFITLLYIENYFMKHRTYTIRDRFSMNLYKISKGLS